MASSWLITTLLNFWLAGRITRASGRLPRPWPDIAGIELIPWQDGAFDVTVNGDLVHSMYRDGGFPEHETIITAVRERMA